jgi:hypothetical protein
MVMYCDTCWYSEPVSCIDIDLYPATYISRIWKAVCRMEVAGSCVRFRYDVRDYGINQEEQNSDRTRLHVLIVVSVEVLLHGAESFLRS